ncbi:MAG: Cyclic di-GMP phosphodiesterase response regulator RpfG [Firmicutes bacterium ADurb.Bin182]|nr:MAG: Cyclic di-GMP phosphodiesterase response regulator RpfG [Firmicutes bacterium ADurb.Bin182]
MSFNNFFGLVRPEHRDRLREAHESAAKSKSVIKCEFPIRAANGVERWIFEQCQGIYDDNGNIEALEGILIDITERKEKENELNYINFHDVLTGLYNRRYFDMQLQSMDDERCLPLSIIIGDIDGLKIINDTLGHIEGDKFITDIAGLLKNCCREGDILARTAGDEFCILLPNTEREEAEKLIKDIRKRCEEYRLKAKNKAYHASISLGCATKTSSDQLFDDYVKLAEENMYKTKLLQSKSLHSSVISSIQASLLEKSRETKEHAQRMIMLSKAVGTKLELSDQMMNDLVLLAILHDIGKIGVNDTILKKPGKLTAEEWAEMKKHPEIGFRIAMASNDLMPVADYILCHHEHWDGSGYPVGLKSEEIPLLSRIISVIDAFDAMTEDRAYSKAMSIKDAKSEIRKNSGSQFDPLIAGIFIDVLEEIFGQESNELDSGGRTV